MFVILHDVIRQELLEKLIKEQEAAAGELPLTKVADDIVPGEGNVDAQVMLIGEAPGYHEVVQRRPFVGRSGRLLRQTLSEVGLPPETVFISNIVKARPPDNRDPSPKEIAAFRPFLDREIQLISPKLIITLGRWSMGKFLPDVRISQVHGRLHKVNWNRQTIFILPMYHPAAGLRSTQVKEAFIRDFQKIHKVLQWINSREQIEERKIEVIGALLG